MSQDDTPPIAEPEVSASPSPMPATPDIPAPVPDTSARIRAQLRRVGDEVEATPLIGDAYDWLRAIALGVRDTAQEMLEEGRKGAKAAEQDAWRRFDAKTKYRRKR